MVEIQRQMQRRISIAEVRVGVSSGTMAVLYTAGIVSSLGTSSLSSSIAVHHTPRLSAGIIFF